MINITAEDVKLFEQNGFTREQVGATIQHYREQGLSDNDIQAKMNAKIGEFKGNTTSPQKARGIDLTPSGMINKAGGAVAAGIAAPFVAARENMPLKEAYNTAYQRGGNFRANDKLAGAQDLITDIAAYSALPNKGGFVGRAAIQGGTPMALESLKAGENPLGGLAGGTLLGAGIQSLPYVGRLAKFVPQAGGLISRTVGRVKPETLKRAVQANSKALDLTEGEAQNLLMNTTERVQRDYKNLLDNAGLDVQKAALNLPDERGVFASSLKNSLDDIYNGYSTSGVRELNPAYNNAGDIYDDITALIDAGTDIPGIGKVSAKNLNDIMGNLKNYPIDWNKTTAKDRQNILKQVYGDFQKRLGNLSPELRKANMRYSKLAKFDDNEGVRRIINPNVIKGENIDSASSALRNYNSTVTKGNTNRNIQDLEKILVANGKEPFINDIDDVNAAMDLLNIRGTGDSWLANMATQATRPALKLARAYNRSNLPQTIQNIKNNLTPIAERYLVPTVSRSVAPLLYGGVEYNEY